MDSKRTHLVLYLALWLSGFSGLTNQVIWQRALKLALGGAESLSSMIVVLVFMAGLGVGSLLAGALTIHRRDHIASFAKVELSLGILNCLVWVLLIYNVDDYFVAAQSFAVTIGLPLKLVRAFISLALLAIPCCLMGMTTPFAAALIQDHGEPGTSERKLPVLFFFNTVGGLSGALATGWYFLPYVGQKAGLLVAIACNIGAALLIWSLNKRAHATIPNPNVTQKKLSLKGSLSKPEVAAFATGALALGYEMMLFRAVSLVYEPLPWVFSSVLCLFLLAWSAGVWLSAKIDTPISLTFNLSALSITCVPSYFVLDRYLLGQGLWPWLLLYFLPVIGFGLLYGQLVQKTAEDWGRDVSRFYFFNTLGSCLGILGMTLGGFQLSVEWNCFSLAIGLALTSFLYSDRVSLVKTWVILIALAIAGQSITREVLPAKQPEAFFGTDGVVEVVGDNVFIDGLWHSKLARGDYLATNNWFMALTPLLAHQEPEKVKDVLIVGFGTGITAHVFLGHPLITSVESYETNRTLQRVFDEYPDETMNVLQEPRIELFWQDGRSGLELRSKSYDIISSAPLYLKQAGSASLLSEEYFRKMKKRLKANGLVAIYSNGNEGQRLLVRKTLARVFPYTASILGGYLLLASNEEMNLNAQSIAEFEKRDWPIAAELREFNRRPKGYETLIDSGLQWTDNTNYLITDDHPLVEYPEIVEHLLKPER